VSEMKIQTELKRQSNPATR